MVAHTALGAVFRHLGSYIVFVPLVGVPGVYVLRLRLAPCEVIAVFLGFVRAHVAFRPERAARKAEVNPPVRGGKCFGDKNKAIQF